MQELLDGNWEKLDFKIRNILYLSAVNVIGKPTFRKICRNLVIMESNTTCSIIIWAVKRERNFAYTKGYSHYNPMLSNFTTIHTSGHTF